MIYCKENNPHRFCNALADAAAAAKCKLARRPFNRFQPETTSWWLVPSSALPFYQFKKIYINWTDKQHNAMLCGLYFEKGLAPELACVYPSSKGRSLLMAPKWYWLQFAESCTDGSFIQKLRTAAETSKFKLEIHIAGGYVDDPTLFDPYGEKQKKDYYIFDLEKDLQNLKYRSAIRDAMVLKCLNKVHNLDNLCAICQKLDEEQFLWLDIFIAARFKISGASTPATDITNLEHIWNNYLSILFAH